MSFKPVNVVVDVDTHTHAAVDGGRRDSQQRHVSCNESSVQDEILVCFSHLFHLFTHNKLRLSAVDLRGLMLQYVANNNVNSYCVEIYFYKTLLTLPIQRL